MLTFRLLFLFYRWYILVTLWNSCKVAFFVRRCSKISVLLMNIHNWFSNNSSHCYMLYFVFVSCAYRLRSHFIQSRYVSIDLHRSYSSFIRLFNRIVDCYCIFDFNLRCEKMWLSCEYTFNRWVIATESFVFHCKFRVCGNEVEYSRPTAYVLYAYISCKSHGLLSSPSTHHDKQISHTHCQCCSWLACNVKMNGH